MKAAIIGRAIFDKVSSINSRINKFEGTLERILKDWQENGSMPENAPKCIQRYIIEEKDKEKFYKAFQAKLKDELIENNPTNIDRLIQIFTQAKNPEINQRVVHITTEVIEEDLNSKKSNLKKNEELNKNLLEIMKNNFAEFYKVNDQVEDKSINNNSGKTQGGKDSPISKDKTSKNNKIDSKNIPLAPAVAYENLIKLLTKKSEAESSTSPTDHKEEIQRLDNSLSNSSSEKKICDKTDNTQSTQNIIETEEKLPKEVESAGGQSLLDKGGYLEFQD